MRSAQTNGEGLDKPRLGTETTQCVALVVTLMHACVPTGGHDCVGVGDSPAICAQFMARISRLDAAGRKRENGS